MTRYFIVAILALTTLPAHAYVGLENGFGLLATQIDNGGGNDGYLDLTGSVTTDFTASFEGRLGPQQVYLSLDSGSILQHPLGGDNAPIGFGVETWPSLEFDSFLTMGGWTVETSSPVLNIDGAVNIPGAPLRLSNKNFGTAGISRAFAPAPGTSVYDQIDYSLGRLTLSGDASGEFYYLGSSGYNGDYQESLYRMSLSGGVFGAPELVRYRAPWSIRKNATPVVVEPVEPVLLPPPPSLPEPEPTPAWPPNPEHAAYLPPQYVPGVLTAPPDLIEGSTDVHESLFFEVEQYDTPGYEGFTTYDISVGVRGGGFQSIGGRAVGLLRQEYTESGGAKYAYSDDWTDEQRLADTQSLVPGRYTSLWVEPFWSEFQYDRAQMVELGEVEEFQAQYGPEESDVAEIIRIVTDQPDKVLLSGGSEVWSDHASVEGPYDYATVGFDLLLSEIGDYSQATAPVFTAPPEPEAPPEPVTPIEPISAPEPRPSDPIAPVIPIEPLEPVEVIEPIETVVEQPAPVEPAPVEPVTPEPTTDPVVVEPVDPTPIITTPGEVAIGDVWIPPEDWDPFYLTDSPYYCDCFYENDHEIDIDMLRGAVTPIVEVSRGDLIFTTAFNGATPSAPVAFNTGVNSALPAIPEPTGFGLLVCGGAGLIVGRKA